MLLLINRRYPALGAVLGVVAALIFIAIGVETSRTMLVVMGAISILLSVARTAQRQRSESPGSTLGR
jgi:hypothetical protein